MVHQTLVRNNLIQYVVVDNSMLTALSGSICRGCLFIKTFVFFAGRTVYIEPFALVEPTNELKSVVEELKAEENIVFFNMCK